MSEEEVLKLWKSGLSKHKIAQIYRIRFNQHIKMIRLQINHRHSGRIISNKEALRYVETIIYRYVMIERNKSFEKNV